MFDVLLRMISIPLILEYGGDDVLDYGSKLTSRAVYNPQLPYQLLTNPFNDALGQLSTSRVQTSGCGVNVGRETAPIRYYCKQSLLYLQTWCTVARCALSDIRVSHSCAWALSRAIGEWEVTGCLLRGGKRWLGASLRSSKDHSESHITTHP